jgi:hypothetical protein
MPAKLKKTSVQLPPSVLRVGPWPGLSQSESIRLSVEIAHYLFTLNSNDISGIAVVYAPILRDALEDLGYEDFRLVARSLPAIVAGYVSEGNTGWTQQDGSALDPKKLIAELGELDAVGRIGILQCVVAERNRRAEKGEEQAEPRPTRVRKKRIA